MNPLLINFAPTGALLTKNDTEFVPIDPNQIIEEVHQAHEVGITVAHLHARDKDGCTTSTSNIYGLIFDGLRKHCPDLVICASLSSRNVHLLEQRAEVLQLQPDMGSLTLSSLNFINSTSVNAPDIIQGLIKEMERFGVKPELECFDAGMINYANYLIRKGNLNPPFYFNLLFGNIASVQADMAYAGLLIRDLPDNSYWALAGLGNEQLKMNTLAIAFGGGVRVGLEDNIWFDTRKKHKSTNISLLRRIHDLASIFERPIMSSSSFGDAGFYNSNHKKYSDLSNI